MTNELNRNADPAIMDRDFHLHPFTALSEHANSKPIIMMKGKGVRLWDQSDNEYIDAMAGLWCVNIGYGREEVAEAISTQALTLPYFHGFTSMVSAPPALLAEKIIDMTPSRLSRVFYGISGSDANDSATKIVWYYNNVLGRPKKKKIIARDRAYHGVTVAAGSLTGLEGVHKAFDLPIFDVLRLSVPHYYWAAGDGLTEEEFTDQLVQEITNMIEREGADTIAAFIAEPIMGAGGVILPPVGYFEKIQKILKANDILFIADEVICGFGRLGKNFGSEVFALDPDIMTIAKGITSGYQPLSGCIVSQEVYEGLEKGSDEIGFFGHGYTYSAHPIPAAAALANLDLIERDGLVANASKTGAYFQQQLCERAGGHPLTGDVRGTGLIAAVELSASKDRHISFDPALGVAKRVYTKALEKGMITRALQASDILSFCPPLTVTRSEVDEVVDKLVDSLDTVCDELVSEGSLKVGGNMSFCKPRDTAGLEVKLRNKA